MLAITAATKGSSREKLHQGLKLKAWKCVVGMVNSDYYKMLKITFKFNQCHCKKTLELFH